VDIGNWKGAMSVKQINRAVATETKTWLCPVCGLKRNIGNHQKCSKITQMKYMKEKGEI